MNLSDRITQLRTEVILMARKSQAIYEKSIECLNTRNEALVADVRHLDAEIDDFELRLDRMCVELLALQEPYAFDFRFVFSVVKIIKDLERVGDQAKTVAKWSPRLPAPPDENMLTLAARAGEALNTAVRALVEDDRALAEKVMEIEFTGDEIEDRIIESATSVAEAFIAKAIERIGDLATNLAENVIFTVSARDIRHGHFHTPEV